MGAEAVDWKFILHYGQLASNLPIKATSHKTAEIHCLFYVNELQVSYLVQYT